jgi:hypothetical protein
VTASIQENLAGPTHEAEAPATRAARVEAETRIAVEIYNAIPSPEGRIQAWQEKTGRSRRAFYRRLENAQQGP